MNCENSQKRESEKSLVVSPERKSLAEPRIDLFPRALTYVIQNEIGNDWETGGFTNDQNDSGKATKWGITQKTLAAYRGRPVSIGDIELLTFGEAQEIYRELFWERLHLDCVTRPQISTALFDASVLFGQTLAAFNGQIACQRVGYRIKVDGLIGPKTLEALNSVRVQSWIPAFQECLQKRITKIVARIPKNKIYERGWRNRVTRLKILVTL
jgi:lysozyme family protein